MATTRPPKRLRNDRAAIHYSTLMVKMRARACVISQLTGLPPLAVRDLWQRTAGKSSPSGQQPNDLAWYTKTPIRRYHSALIVQFYSRALKTLPPYAALTHAYYHYARLTAPQKHKSTWVEYGDPAFRATEQDYEVSFARANYLCQIYTDDELSTGRRKCHLMIKRCRKCGGIYMSHENEAHSYCPLCDK